MTNEDIDQIIDEEVELYLNEKKKKKKKKKKKVDEQGKYGRTVADSSSEDSSDDGTW